MNGSNEAGAWLEDDKGRRFPVRGTCAIGRSSGNQVVLADDLASRRHALVHAQEQDQYWLVDLGSRNGTELDGRRVSRPTLLREGGRIKIGGATLVFHQPRVAEADAMGVSAAGTVMQIKATACWLLVADIVGSTQLEAQYPAEELPVVTGRWLAECTHVVEQREGTVNKYLGDGFLAYWKDGEAVPPRVGSVAEALGEFQARSPLAFRFVLHVGKVLIGGESLGEENLSGREVNFIFRMEKLASGLGLVRLFSEPAHERLSSHLPTVSAGRHGLPSFDGEFPFFTF